MAFHCFVGVAEGIVVSWLPAVFAGLPVAGILLLWVLRLVVVMLRKEEHGWGLLGIRVVAAFLTILTCGLLPVKWEDGGVDPVQCGPMRAEDLARIIGPWVGGHLGVRLPDASDQEKVVSFSTDRRLPRKQFLEELGRQTGFEVDASCCGLGHSILFGEEPRWVLLKSPEPQTAGPGTVPSPRTATADVDETCARILSSVRAGHVTVNRDILERLEGLAKAKPEILAPPASSRKAIDIAGRTGAWPVVENKGFWFVLENQGHPASDVFFRVSVVDGAAGRLVGRIADSTGNVPAAYVPISSEAVEVAALEWLLSKETPIGDLDVAKQGIQQVLLRSKAAFPAQLGGVKLIPDDNKMPGLVVAISAVQASSAKATVTVSVDHRDGQGRIAPDGSSHGEFEFTLADGTWTHTKTLKNVVK